MRKSGLITLGVLIVAGVGGYYFYKRSMEKRDAEAAEFLNFVIKNLDPESVKQALFSTNIKGTATSKKLSTTDATKYAKAIYGAWGWVNDDEEAIKTVLRACKTQEQISQVATIYQSLYKVALLADLESKLSESEFAEMQKIVELKPLYA
jgi:hypothetical protein